MRDMHVSIGRVKRDISTLVNQVAFGGERVVLTSRGKPKAAIVSMDDYERLSGAGDAVDRGAGDAVDRLETWLAASDELAARIASKLSSEEYDADSLIETAKTDLEKRHDFLRNN
jgi:prevent-host-death family protein